MLLFEKLRGHGAPTCFIDVMSDWYNKMYATVRWNDVLSKSFAVGSGVRQGGVLSPVLFNVYVDGIFDALSENGVGCHVHKLFCGCIMYADDILMLWPSVNGLQLTLDVCFEFSRKNHIYLIL